MIYRICRGIAAFGSGAVATPLIGTSFMAASVGCAKPPSNRKRRTYQLSK